MERVDLVKEEKPRQKYFICLAVHRAKLPYDIYWSKLPSDQNLVLPIPFGGFPVGGVISVKKKGSGHEHLALGG